MQPPARDLVAVWSTSLPINSVTDWIRGLCPADTLLVWFPAHWAPIVTRKLHEANNLWFDQPGAEAHLRLKKWEAQECRSMKFRLSNFGKSEVPLLSCAIRVDWLSIPLQRFLAKLGCLKQGVLAGTFRTKTASP